MASVPSQSAAGRLLWRLEQRDHRADLLVLSPTRPSWEHLVEQAGWPGADGGEARIAAYEPLLALLMIGRRFAFRLTANPVRNTSKLEHPTPSQIEKVADPGKARSPRVGHRTAQYQLDWLLKRCADDDHRWGFTVGSSAEPSVALVERRTLRFSKGAGQWPVTLDTATFQGWLTVTDPDLMRRSLLEGIGSGKAYGCGLLTLARP